MFTVVSSGGDGSGPQEVRHVHTLCSFCFVIDPSLMLTCFYMFFLLLFFPPNCPGESSHTHSAADSTSDPLKNQQTKSKILWLRKSFPLILDDVILNLSWEICHVVVEWLALLPHNKTWIGLNPGVTLLTFYMEDGCSFSVCFQVIRKTKKKYMVGPLKCIKCQLSNIIIYSLPFLRER